MSVEGQHRVTAAGRTQTVTTSSRVSHNWHRRLIRPEYAPKVSGRICALFCVCTTPPLSAARRARQGRSLPLPVTVSPMTCAVKQGQKPPLNPAARHDAPAAPARFVGRKLLPGRPTSKPHQCTQCMAFGLHFVLREITRFSAQAAHLPQCLRRHPACEPWA